MKKYIGLLTISALFSCTAKKVLVAEVAASKELTSEKIIAKSSQEFLIVKLKKKILKNAFYLHQLSHPFGTIPLRVMKQKILTKRKRAQKRIY